MKSSREISYSKVFSSGSPDLIWLVVKVDSTSSSPRLSSHLLSSWVNIMVADENDKDADATNGSTVIGTIVDVVSDVAVVCFFGSVKSCVPRLFLKKLNEPTARSKPNSSPAKVSWNAGRCGVKSDVGSDVLFVGEVVDASFVMWSGDWGYPHQYPW